jgi:hypothetical protein
MPTRKKNVPLPPEEEPVAATDPQTSPNAPDPTTVAAEGVSEYELADGSTYLLTAREAEQRGAKAVSRPANKAVTPSDK